MSKPIQIFKSGRHTAMNGTALDFSESDLAASAKAYNPALHEAPIVVGHPKTDGPAYGWVKSLSYADGLDAEPYQVDAEFAEMVSAGRFKKVSASFYTPDSPSNPVPGVYYLRHVGFLGAQPPGVKGLRQAAFAEREQGIVEFADWDDQTNAGLWRGMRDWIINKFGMDEADKAIPSWNVQSLADAAAQAEPDGDDQAEPDGDDLSPTPSFSEKTQPKGDEMSVEDKARLAALEKENAKLKADQASFAEADKKRRADASHAEHVAFSETLVRGGQLLPAQKDVAVATLDFLATQGTVVEFGEGDAKKPLADALMEMLKSFPQQVDFGESAAGDHTTNAALGDFIVPHGYGVDTEKLEIHNKALQFQESNKCDYLTAIKAVGGK